VTTTTPLDSAPSTDTRRRSGAWRSRVIWFWYIASEPSMASTSAGAPGGAFSGSRALRSATRFRTAVRVSSMPRPSLRAANHTRTSSTTAASQPATMTTCRLSAGRSPVSMWGSSAPAPTAAPAPAPIMLVWISR
jgi:hypothetical protein